MAAADLAVAVAEIVQRHGEVIEEGRVGGRQLAERIDAHQPGIGAMAPYVPPQIGRRLWFQAAGQECEVIVGEGCRNRSSMLLSDVDLCRPWPVVYL